MLAYAANEDARQTTPIDVEAGNRIADVEEAVQQLLKQQPGLVSTVRTLVTQVAALRAENGELRKLRAENDGLRADVDGLTQVANGLIKEVAFAKERLVRLRSLITDLQDFSERSTDVINTINSEVFDSSGRSVTAAAAANAQQLRASIDEIKRELERFRRGTDAAAPRSAVRALLTAPQADGRPATAAAAAEPDPERLTVAETADQALLYDIRTWPLVRVEIERLFRFLQDSYRRPPPNAPLTVGADDMKKLDTKYNAIVSRFDTAARDGPDWARQTPSVAQDVNRLIAELNLMVQKFYFDRNIDVPALLRDWDRDRIGDVLPRVPVQQRDPSIAKLVASHAGNTKMKAEVLSVMQSMEKLKAVGTDGKAAKPTPKASPKKSKQAKDDEGD